MNRSHEGAPARISFWLNGWSMAAAVFLAGALVACAGDEASSEVRGDQPPDVAATSTPEAEYLPQLITRPLLGQRGPIRNVASGKCLDASNYGRGQQIIQYDCLGGDNQLWKITTYHAYDFAIVNVASGKCLDASDYGSGENVIQWECTYEAHQLWRWVTSPRGIKIVNMKSGKCLDASDYGRGERVIQYDCLDAHPNQQWFDEVSRPHIDGPPTVPAPAGTRTNYASYFVTCRCESGVYTARHLCLYKDATSAQSKAQEACDRWCRRVQASAPWESTGSGPNEPCLQTGPTSVL